MAFNPFTPAFGGKSQYFFGRSAEFALVKDALENEFSPYRALFITGNRGCGKTALLEQISELASSYGWLSVDVHAEDALITAVKKIAGGSGKTVTREAHPVAAGFSLGGVSTTTTTAFTGMDLSDLMRSRLEGVNTLQGILISVDEVQKISEKDAEGLSSGLQMALRKGYPVMLVMAGLPNSKEKIASFKGCTFMERAYDIKLSSLLIDETYDAFRSLLSLVPDMRVEDGVVDRLARFSLGYPYLIQLVGYYAVQQAQPPHAAEVFRLRENDIALAEVNAYAAYRDNVLKAVLRDVRNGNLEYLRAVAAELDDQGRAKTSEVAQLLGKDSSQCTSMRQRLIDRRLIVADGWGYVRFNMPYLGKYLLETGVEEESNPSSERTWKF